MRKLLHKAKRPPCKHVVTIHGDHDKRVGGYCEARCSSDGKRAVWNTRTPRVSIRLAPSVQSGAAVVVAPVQLEVPSDAELRSDTRADRFRVFLHCGAQGEFWNLLFKIGRKLQCQFPALIGGADFELHGGGVASRADTGEPPKIAHDREARRSLLQVEDRERALEERCDLPQFGIDGASS